ncbi:hypothetical protein [Jiella pacifica]|uniref:Uncharacterized protein n=1 Tax=Jiella pacifica TaxID=2696469 RepID=A0A6N9T7C9_9HYPH|nr:hypothetical protein [Jiella pacifica]NDW05976.1 hypothetical protein [Jiella pacifica]
MTCERTVVALAASILAMAPAPLAAQPAGGTPPEDIAITVSRSADGIALSEDAITLAVGKYYRLGFACTSSDAGDPSFSFDTTPLLRDVHLRVLTVDAIEVYLQGLSFRALQCEGAGSVRFSFYPMRAGNYAVPITDQTDDAVKTSLRVTVE